MVAQSAGAAEAVPMSPFLPDVNSPPCALVSRLPQRRDRVPSRCGLGRHTAQRVKAAREVAGSGRGALVLALTAVLDSGRRTGGTSLLTRARWMKTREPLSRNEEFREVFLW